MLKNSVLQIRKLGKRFKSSEKGATAIEFAMVAFPFFALMGVIIETGAMMFTEYGLQAAVQEAARTARTGSAQGANKSAADFKTLICKNASIGASCTSNLVVYANSYTSWAQLASNMPSFISIGVKDDGTAGASAYKLGAPVCPSSLVATYDWTFTMPLMNYLGNIKGNTARRLVGFAMFQTEPYPSSGGSAC
ncbi:MAG: pilus assembly protein [Alphaproteobacteria bacterium]|nr:pilus assembly protein [Alphaproteobacteria bacterium]